MKVYKNIYFEGLNPYESRRVLFFRLETEIIIKLNIMF